MVQRRADDSQYRLLGGESELAVVRSYVWFPVGNAVLRVRGSLANPSPPRRNWFGPVKVHAVQQGITACAAAPYARAGRRQAGAGRNVNGSHGVKRPAVFPARSSITPTSSIAAGAPSPSARSSTWVQNTFG